LQPAVWQLGAEGSANSKKTKRDPLKKGALVVWWRSGGIVKKKKTFGKG